MKYLSKSLWNRSMLAFAVFAAAASQQVARADDSLHCYAGNAVMNGVYVMSGRGNLVGVGPVVMAGEVVYNGNGTGTLLSSTLNVNGTIVGYTQVPVVFTVNPDCTGSKTLGTGSSATHYNFVITPDGSTITWVETDANAVISGKAVRASQ
jgi:hypothetical protein